MNNFIKLTKADGRIMIIDVNNVQCIEQVDGLTLVHFKSRQNSLYYEEHIDHIWSMLTTLNEGAK